MLDRITSPVGWACPAGHIEEGETPETALYREVAEETGLKVDKMREVFHGVLLNKCSRGFDSHEWWVFSVQAYEGQPMLRELRKHRGIAWKPIDEIDSLILDPAWKMVFEEIDISNITRTDNTN